MNRGQASRRRLLDTAAAEFAAHGIAGARVDRISVDAKVSKAQMYAYYQGKEGLFDAVLADQAEAIVTAVPLTADDLPGYVVRLYDVYLERPQLVRLALWARLERFPAGPLFSPEDPSKIESIVRAQRAGRVVGGIPATDIHAMVVTLALTWSPASLIHTATPADPAADHDRRRAALAAAVRAAFVRQDPTEA